MTPLSDAIITQQLIFCLCGLYRSFFLPPCMAVYVLLWVCVSFSCSAVNTHTHTVQPPPPHHHPHTPYSPMSLFTITRAALTLDLLTQCVVSGSVRVWCWWHCRSQRLRRHLRLHCPLCSWQWAALSRRSSALARHAPSVNDERERESRAESAGLVWPTAMAAALIGRRLFSPDSNFCDLWR